VPVYWLAITLVFILSTPAIGAAADPQLAKKSDETDAPFRVFVFEPSKTEDGKAPLAKVTEIVKKKIADRDKWLLLVDNAMEAEIQLEVSNEWEEGETPDSVERTPMHPGMTPQYTNTAGVKAPRVGRGQNYYIEFIYSIPGQFKQRTTVIGEDREAAAKEIPKRLKTICDVYCRESK
jgi:hypothetical protein